MNNNQTANHFDPVKNLGKCINELLEVLHIVSHDGYFSDIEALEQFLTDIGVSQETIAYHKKAE